MKSKKIYFLFIFISVLLITTNLSICQAKNANRYSTITIIYQRDTTAISSRSQISKPNDSIISVKLRKSKLLSKEGIVIKQSANNTDIFLTNKVDSSLKINAIDVETDKSIDKIKINVSKIIAIPFKTNNLTEEPPTPLFKQLTDRNSLSKIEFLNTIKELNQLKKEIYQKNTEQKKVNPIHWLLLLIAAILIIIVLALFIKEILTLVLISIMLVALVLLLGFL